MLYNRINLNGVDYMYDIICNPVSGKGSSLAALEKVENILKAGNMCI